MARVKQLPGTRRLECVLCRGPGGPGVQWARGRQKLEAGERQRGLKWRQKVEKERESVWPHHSSGGGGGGGGGGETLGNDLGERTSNIGLLAFGVPDHN